MGSIIAVKISEKKGVIKHPIDQGYFRVNDGLEGDAHKGDWHRQVSLLGKESIDKIKALKVDGLCSKKFSENLTTEGIVLYEIPVGKKIRIGEVVLEVTQIGKECYKGCKIRELAGECVMPKEGIFARVLENGYIKVGDKIEIL